MNLYSTAEQSGLSPHFIAPGKSFPVTDDLHDPFGIKRQSVLRFSHKPFKLFQ